MDAPAFLSARRDPAPADSRADLALAREREAAAQQRAAELTKVNEALTIRSQLLSVVAEVSKDLLTADNFERAVQTTLARIGEGARLSRVVLLFEEIDAGNGRREHRVAQEWCAPGVPSHAECGITIIPSEDAAAFIDLLHRNESFWKRLEEVEQPLRHAFERLGIQATGCAPLCVDGVYAGCLAFDDCRTPRTWEEAQVDALTAAANAIGAAVQGQRLTARLLNEREQAAQERAAQLARANAALSRSLDGLVGHGQLETFLDSVLREAITASGAVSGAVFVHETADDTLRAVALILRGESLEITRDPRADAFGRPIPAATGLAWQIVGEQHEVFWIDYNEPDPRDWPQSYAWHQAQGHRFVACMPMLLAGEAVGFLGLAFDKSEVVQPTETRLELCRVLAQQATLALHLTRLAESAREFAVAREREAAAQEQIAALTEANRLLQRGAARLSAGGTPEEFTKPFLEEMYALLDADSAAQFVVDDAAGTLTGWALYDRGQWMARAAVRHARVADIPAWDEIIAHPERPTIFRLDDPHDVDRVFPESVAFLRARGCTWLLNLPLVVGGRVAWVLGVNGIARGRLTERNLAVFTTLARHLTLALELHRLGEEARALAVIREREAAAQARAAELARTNAAVGDSLNELVELTDLRAFLRQVFGQCARLSGALGGGLFFHDEATDTLCKQLGWIKGEVVDFAGEGGESFWREPVPTATIPDWTELVQIDAGSERIWQNARPWHKAQGYGWLSRVPLKAGAQAFGFLGMAFARREDLSAEKAELICAMSHQIALAVQLDRLGGEAKEAAVLAERNRIARDLHDVLAQGFVGVLAQLGVLEGALEMDDPAEVTRIAARVRAIASDGLEEARRSVHSLRPAGQDDRLFERLRAILAGLAAGTPLDASAVETGKAAALSEQADWAAVKFVQQALTNTLRYAAAGTFRLALSWDAPGLTLTAIDDGGGFDPAAPRVGIGLRAMAERAAECGGAFHVDSSAAGGTTLRLFLPFHRETSSS